MDIQVQQRTQISHMKIRKSLEQKYVDSLKRTHVILNFNKWEECFLMSAKSREAIFKNESFKVDTTHCIV